MCMPEKIGIYCYLTDNSFSLSKTHGLDEDQSLKEREEENSVKRHLGDNNEWIW